MTSRNTDMQAIFSELSEKNKDIVILIARSIKVAQEAAEQPHKSPAQMNPRRKNIHESLSTL